MFAAAKQSTLLFINKIFTYDNHRMSYRIMTIYLRHIVPVQATRYHIALISVCLSHVVCVCVCEHLRFITIFVSLFSRHANKVDTNACIMQTNKCVCVCVCVRVCVCMPLMFVSSMFARSDTFLAIYLQYITLFSLVLFIYRYNCRTNFQTNDITRQSASQTNIVLMITDRVQCV